MLLNFLKVALRVLRRDRLYTALNVAGLAIGLAAASMIGLYVHHELSYDRFYPGADRIFRVDKTEYLPGRAPVTYDSTAKPYGPALAQYFPEIDLMVRVYDTQVAVRRDTDLFRDHIALVDPGFLRLFPQRFLAGDPGTALAAPGTVVLSASEARKYFGATGAMGAVVGRVLRLGGGTGLTVTGVIADMPTNSHLREGLLTLMTTRLGNGEDDWLARMDTVWDSNFLHTYIRLRPGADAAALQARFPAFLLARKPGFEPPGSGHTSAALVLTGLTHIHTDPAGSPPGASLLTVLKGFIAVAGLVLGIAVVNFVNLSTARSSLRVREVAVRKALGASRATLVAQFLLESVLISLAAGLLALSLTEIAMPHFVEALKIRFDRALLGSPWLLAAEAGAVLGVGLLGGLYPALVLSRPAPSVLLRGGGMAAGGTRLRTLLVVLQFAAATALGIATIVIFQQTRYASTQNLGFTADGALLLRGLNDPSARAHLDSFREALLRIPGVADAGATRHAPADGSDSSDTYHLAGTADDGTLVLRTESIDNDYLQSMGVRLLAGRLFQRGNGADQPTQQPGGTTEARYGRTEARYSRTAVLSLRAARRLGFTTPAAALGRTVIDGDDPKDTLTLQVVGVIDDIQFNNAYRDLQPTVFVLSDRGMDVMAVRLTPAAGPATLAAIDDLWRGAFPDVPEARSFLDDHVRDQYDGMQRQGRLLGGFAGLAVLIASLGLFGLAAYTAERRTKEIGLRKVMGATVIDIVRLLVWQFSQPVLVANLVAWPLAWVLLSHWLGGFAYRISLDPLIFLVVGAGTLVVAWATVVGHAARVASARPVTSLRYE